MRACGGHLSDGRLSARWAGLCSSMCFGRIYVCARMCACLCMRNDRKEMNGWGDVHPRV